MEIRSIHYRIFRVLWVYKGYFPSQLPTGINDSWQLWRIYAYRPPIWVLENKGIYKFLGGVFSMVTPMKNVQAGVHNGIPIVHFGSYCTCSSNYMFMVLLHILCISWHVQISTYTFTIIGWWHSTVCVTLSKMLCLGKWLPLLKIPVEMPTVLFSCNTELFYTFTKQ